MFKTMNKNEMMIVNGGFYYVPKYENGVYKGLVQISSFDPGVKWIWNGKKVYY